MLRGKLLEKRPNQVLLDVSGVGYQVQIPLSTFAGLGALHAEATLLIHTHLREDQLSLYGFVTAREKQCFELLLSASGVGPSLALKILSGMSIEELVPAIRKGDLAQLVRIPGAGKPATKSQLESDVASALVNLGYDDRSVENAIEKSRGAGNADFESLLRASLQILGGSAMHNAARAARAE